jgi:hypothetical protein
VNRGASEPGARFTARGGVWWLGLALALAAVGCESEGEAAEGGEEGGTTFELPTGTSEGGGTTEGGGTEGGGTGSSTGGTSVQVDPDCADGQYTETLYGPPADISGLIAGYDGDYHALVREVLEVRYPAGAYVVAQSLAKNPGQDCVELFTSNKALASGVIGSLSTVVHECGHMLDFALGGFSKSSYQITEELLLECSGGNSAQLGGQTFARSLITNDEFAALHPPCASFGAPGDCDGYAPLYLNGDPDDENFDSGDQGFNVLFDEVVQYVHSLATGYSLRDQYTFSVSERDGILTFLWYLTRYLRMARLDYPDAYAFLSGDPCWRNAILTVWGRAWLFLDETEGMPQLGLDDDFLMGLVTEPELLGEIQRIRELDGCE